MFRKNNEPMGLEEFKILFDNKIWVSVAVVTAVLFVLDMGVTHSNNTLSSLIGFSKYMGGFFLAASVCLLVLEVKNIVQTSMIFSLIVASTIIILAASKAYSSNVNVRVNTIHSGMEISTVLETGVNPKIPGWVRLIVDKDSLGSDLLPVNTKFICGYEALREGETKLLLECNEVMRPDGSIVRAGHGKQIATAEIKTNKLGLIEFGAKIILRPVKSIVFPKEVEGRNVKQVEGDNND